METQHQLTELCPHRSAVVSKCSCGWASTPACSERHAHRRWEIHNSQQRSARLCFAAFAVASQVRTRVGELSLLAAQARERRAMIAKHRAQLREALLFANRSVRDYRTPSHRIIECGRELAGFSVRELWWRYLGSGGDLSLDALQRVLDGFDPLERVDYEILAMVLNDEFRDEGLGSPLPPQRGALAS